MGYEVRIHIYNTYIWEAPHGRVWRMIKGEIRLIIAYFM